MFMVRLRRSAKWAFIVLIFAFAFSFLFAGVGGGAGDIVQELRNMRGGSDPVKSAEKDVAKHPRNASALNRLALAYGVKDRRGDAINAYKKYLKLKPNDQSGFAQLARLQEEVTALRWNRYAAVQSEMVAASGPLGSDPLQTLAGTDPLLGAYTSLLTTKLSNAYGSYTTAAKAWESTNKSYAKAIPKTNTLLRANVELQLAQAASSAADYTTAIKSYENFLLLTPKSPLAAQVKKILAELQKASSSR
jgi:tetratricopeptide (TPR) repeat protein